MFFNNLKNKFLYKFTKKYWKNINFKHAKLNNYIVQNGLMKGLKLNQDQFWNKDDLGAKIYGFYEQEVQKRISKIAINHKKTTFINIGAADGFFSIGLLLSKKIKKSIAFEMNINGQKSILKNAKLNKVENSIKVYGELNEKNFQSFFSNNFNFKNSLILCDIEGFEYELFSKKILKIIQYSHIIIEIHPTDKNKEEKLLKDVKKHFTVETIFNNINNLNQISSIHDLNDIERSLLICEGRSFIGKWWILSPLNLDK